MKQFKSSLVILSLFLYPILVTAQLDTAKVNQAAFLYEEAMQLANQGQHQASIEKTEASMVLFEETGLWDYYVTTLGLLARNYTQLGDFDKVEELNELSLTMIKEKNLHQDLLIQSYFLSGVLAYEKGNYRSSANFFQAAIDSLNNTENLEGIDPESKEESLAEQAIQAQRAKDQAMGHVYNYAAFPAIALGDFEKSLSYFKKAKQFYHAARDSFNLYNNNINIGSAYNYKGNTSKAIATFKEVESSIEKMQNATVLKAINYNHLTNAYFLNQDFESEKLYLDKLEKLFEEPGIQNLISITGVDHKSAHATLLAKKALNYAHLKQPKKAEQSAQLALNNVKQLEGNLQERISAIRFISNAFYTIGLLEKSISTQQLGLSYISPAFNPTSIFETPKAKDISFKLSSIDLLYSKARTLNAMGQNLKGEEKIKHLKAALQTSETAIELLTDLQYNLVQAAMDKITTEGSLLELVNKYPIVFDQKIELAHHLFDLTQEQQYLEKAFQTSEESKSFILKQALDKVARYKNIPNEIRTKLQQLEADIFFFEKKSLLADITNNEALKTKHERKRDDLKEEHQKLIATIKDNPNTAKYYNDRYRSHTASIAEIQSQLRKNSNKAAIQIYEAKDKIYSFLITSTNHYLSEQTKPTNWNNTIQRLNDLNKNFNLIYSPDLIKEYNEVNSVVFQNIFSDLLEKENNIKQLVIIPHQQSHNINFNILLQAPTEAIFHDIGYDSYQVADISNFNFLIKQYAISYNHSATIFLDDLKKGEPTQAYDYQLLGFIPDYTYRNQTAKQFNERKVALLPDETASILKLFPKNKVKIIRGAMATEQTFRTTIDRISANILHISAHGKIENRNALFSKLLLSRNTNTSTPFDDNLEVGELYNLNIFVQLAILSACETGSGTLKGGEGKISLARGFAYANCPGIIMSLWPLETNSNQKIIDRLYSELINNKQAVDLALRSAQLSYLQELQLNWGNNNDLNAEEKEQTLRSMHPFFWAGLVPIGRVAPLSIR